MNRIGQGHPEAHEKLTARLFWKLRADSGYNNAGNVKEYADATTRSLVVRARAEDGARHVNDEQVDLNHESYTFLLDERMAEQEKLIKLAKQYDDEIQLLGEGSTASITGAVGGRWFAIGAYNIDNVTVTASASGGQVEGTDYELDRENGRIQVIAGAGISDGETLTLTFDQPRMEMEKFESQANPLFYCDLIVEECNQYSAMWLRRMSFSGYLNITEFPTQSGEFGVYRAKVTPSGPVMVLKRAEGQTLPTVTASTEGPAHSSSSSSNSSSTSSVSDSSQST